VLASLRTLNWENACQLSRPFCTVTAMLNEDDVTMLHPIGRHANHQQLDEVHGVVARGRATCGATLLGNSGPSGDASAGERAPHVGLKLLDQARIVDVGGPQGRPDHSSDGAVDPVAQLGSDGCVVERAAQLVDSRDVVGPRVFHARMVRPMADAVKSLGVARPTAPVADLRPLDRSKIASELVGRRGLELLRRGPRGFATARLRPSREREFLRRPIRTFMKLKRSNFGHT
jgi:hypothetical protein